MLEMATYLKDPHPLAAAKEILCKLSNEKRSIRGRQIRLELQGTLEKIIQEALIYALMRHRALIVEVPSQSIDDYLFSIDYDRLLDYMDTEIAAAEVLKNAESASPAIHTLDVEFVATIPPSIIFSPDIENISQIDPSIKRLIAGAKTDLRIVNPFFDEYGVSAILPALLAAAECGVNIRIITREIFNPRKNARLVKALIRLIGAFIEKNLQVKLAIRDFYKWDKCGNKQIYAVHSKFLIADGNAAYIGSANLTETSLKSNFEIGVILRGEGIKPLIAIAEAIWIKSDYVDLQQLLSMRDNL